MKSLVLILTAVFLLLSCGREKTAEELIVLAQESYDKGEFYKSRKYLAEAIKLKPNEKEIVFQIGRAYMAENMFDSAFAHLSRADKLYPNDRRIIQLLHEASVKSKNWNAAIGALLSLARTGDPIENFYRQIGEYALKDSSGHIAYYYYGMLIELEPDSMSHYLNQAEGGIIEGEPQKSIEVLKAALKRFGDQPELLYQLGRLYSVTGNLNEAEKLYRLLVAKDPSVFNRLQLATTLSLQNSRSKKEEAYAMFKEVRPETNNVRRVDSILAVLEKELTIRQ